MTDAQERFCEEYLIDLNATQAAIRAGYSVAGAGQQGCELLKNPNVSARIGELIAERSKRTGANADRVVRELARIAFVNSKDVVSFTDASLISGALEDDTAAVASVKVKITPTKNGDSIEREIKFNDKNRALELLGKHLGMFTDKFEVSVDTAQEDALKNLADIALKMKESE